MNIIKNNNKCIPQNDSTDFYFLLFNFLCSYNQKKVKSEKNLMN